MAGQSVRAARNPFLGGPARVKFTIGTEAANVIKVTAALKTANRTDAGGIPADRQHVLAYLTQNTSTLAVAGTAPSGTVAIAAKGTIVVSPTAKLVHHVVCDANGEFDLNITEAGVATWYLVVVVNGRVFRSNAITFA